MTLAKNNSKKSAKKNLNNNNINFKNSFCVDILWPQKIMKPNCRKKKAAQNNFATKNCLKNIKILVKMTPKLILSTFFQVDFAFTDPKSAKKTDKLDCPFCAFGICAGKSSS